MSNELDANEQNEVHFSRAFQVHEVEAEQGFPSHEKDLVRVLSTRHKASA